MRSSSCGSEFWKRDVNHVRLIWIRGGLILAPSPGFARLSGGGDLKEVWLGLCG